MNKFYETVIEDCQKTIQRLNNECDNRVDYESSLISIISNQQKVINELKKTKQETLEDIYIWLMADFVCLQSRLAEAGKLDWEESAIQIDALNELIMRYKEHYHIEGLNI